MKNLGMIKSINSRYIVDRNPDSMFNIFIYSITCYNICIIKEN